MEILSAFGADQTVPLPPRALNTTAVSGTQIFLIWTAPINATQSGVTGYKIEYKISSGSYQVLVANTNNLQTSYLHTGLILGTTYIYRISATNSFGVSNPSLEAFATTLSMPSAPTNLVASVVSSSQINLSWNAPDKNGGTAIIGYKILKRNSCEDNYVIIDTGNTSTTYSDSGLSANTCYRYNLFAYNAIGTSRASFDATAITKPVPVQTHVPSAPTGLSVTALSSTSLKLTWNMPSDNGGVAISGYLIQRNGTTIVNNTFTNQAIYIDTNLLPIHQQTYRIAVWNSFGLSSFSNTVSHTTNPSTTQGSSGNQIGNGTTTDLDQQLSDFIHIRNEFLKQQRAEFVNLIHECHTKVKNASSSDRKQIRDDCKEKIKEIREKYKDVRNQLKEQFKEIRDKLNSQIKEEKKNNEVDEKEIKQSNKELREDNNELEKNKKQHDQEDD